MCAWKFREAEREREQERTRESERVHIIAGLRLWLAETVWCSMNMLQPTHRWRAANTLRQCCDTAQWCHLIVDVRSIHNRIKQMPHYITHAFILAFKSMHKLLLNKILLCTDYRIIFKVYINKLLASALKHLSLIGEISMHCVRFQNLRVDDDDTSLAAF